jgi:uncharacterized protein
MLSSCRGVCGLSNVSDKTKKGIFGSGRLIALAIAAGMLLSIGGPSSAQFFNFGGYQQRSQPQRGGGWFGGGWFGNDTYQPFERMPQPRQTRPPVREDFSRAPPPEKRETVPERRVLVLGDGMADWLAYGLEDAYAEQPDMGVIRKARNTSGLIKYQPRGDPANWAAAAKGILTTEKPDIIVVMLGLNDRVAMREPVTEKSDKPADKKGDKKDDKKDAHAKGDAKSDGKGGAKPEPKPKPEAAQKQKNETELPQDDADNAEVPPVKSARSANGLYEFHEDRWVELYAKKIEEMIAALKVKDVPVVWVGLPAIRGTKGTADMLFLDSLYREASAKAGITYVDVWDGFVDEGGLFLQKGPDFEGQIRQLRSYDGVYFTKPGARKLAHYVEREITRLLAARSAPIALPTEPATPDANAVPGQPAPRPLAGPILPLTAPSLDTDQLLGGPGTRPAAVDALAARTLVKGEALSPPPGRADDFAWPRREVGREEIKADTPVASASPNGLRDVHAQARAPALLKPRKQHRSWSPAPILGETGVLR